MVRWLEFEEKKNEIFNRTFFTNRHLITLSFNGCVVISNNKKFCFSVVSTPFSTKFLARRSRTFFSLYRNFNGFHVSPLRYSIQLCTVSGGSVSFMCFNASSNKTSPVGVSDFNITFLLKNRGTKRLN